MELNNEKYSRSKGRIDCTVDNIVTFLNNDSKFAGRLMYNAYTNEQECDGEEITDEVFNRIVNDVERGLGEFVPNKVRNALDELFADPTKQYNPLKDYLKGLAWDGVKRIETACIDWLKADDTRLYRAMTLKWFFGGVKRAMEPGCKFDGVIILQGPQGIGKSLFCERLSAGFGVADNIDIDQSKEYVPLLKTSWICVMDELRGFTRKEQNAIKNFLSKTEDKVRLAYRTNSKVYKRHCVFIGSTNDDTFLNDYSQMTERRYWVIKCNATEKDGSYLYKHFTKDVVDQLWAEAYYLYKKNPDYELELEPDLKQLLKEDQRQYKTFIDDPTYEFLKDILTRKYPNKEFQYNQFRDMIERPSEYNGVYELDRIPVRFINNIIAESRCTVTRSSAWLKTVMDDLGWKKMSCMYKATGKKESCWKRIDSNGLFNDEE